MTVTDILGWSGALLILTAYALLTLGKLKGNQALYHLINLIGAGLVAYDVFHKGSYGATFLNAAWFGIALCGILRCFNNGR